jgi:putative oxidoreductase
LRRLYSTFAGSWPGIGLLLMRLVLGSVLLLGACSNLWNDPPLQTALTSASLTGSGFLLVAGLWTPLAGTVVVLIEISQILTSDGDPLACLLAATIGGAVAMLGPGRWSVDARLFGWKRVEASPRRSPNVL